MNQIDGLLQAILDHPEDDGLRLIYADRCGEQGDLARAEFVRCQIKLAGIEQINGGSAKFWQSVHDNLRNALCRCPACSLWRRQHQLLQAHYPDWLPYVMHGTQVIGGPDDTGRCIVPPFEGVWFRRGFVDEARCRLADWAGEACRQCLGHGSYRTTVAHDGRHVRHYDCDVCQGTGRVGAHGPAIVGLQPVTCVRLTDREPACLENIWYWADNRTDQTMCLPGLVLAHMNWRRRSLGHVFFDTRVAAEECLSAALIAWAKASAVKGPAAVREGE